VQIRAVVPGPLIGGVKVTVTKQGAKHVFVWIVVAGFLCAILLWSHLPETLQSIVIMLPIIFIGCFLLFIVRTARKDGRLPKDPISQLLYISFLPFLKIDPPLGSVRKETPPPEPANKHDDPRAI
jgi:hypothetical protein